MTGGSREASSRTEKVVSRMADSHLSSSIFSFLLPPARPVPCSSHGDYHYLFQDMCGRANLAYPLRRCSLRLREIVGGGHEQRLLGVYSRDIWGNFPTGPFILRRWVRQPRQWLEGLVRGWARLLIGPRSDLPGGPWMVPPEPTFLNLPGGPGITSPATRLAQIGESVDSE